MSNDDIDDDGDDDEWFPRAVEEYEEYSHAARTGQHRLRSSLLLEPCFDELHAVFMPLKSSFERDKGHPLT